MDVRKRLYIGLLSITLLLFAAVIVYTWLAVFGENSMGLLRYVFAGAVLLVLSMLFVIGLGFLGIIASLLCVRRFKFLEKPMNFTVSMLYPAVMKIGKTFRIAQDQIQRSFVEVNNQLVKSRKGLLRPEELLILLPHCLQYNDCANRITTNPDNCKRCGSCSIGELLDLAENYGVHLRIATGGTLARESVKQIKPKAIVAIACERDLTNGILDCIPLPVLGVTNERPMGPCFNTTVSYDAVENAILYFLRGGKENVFSA